MRHGTAPKPCRSVKSQCHAHCGTNLTLGQETLGFARQFGAEKNRCTNHFVGCGRCAEALRTGGERIMECSRLRVDARNTRRLRLPEEPLAFLVLEQS